MASLSPPFILCPLTDRKALLGIRPDRLQNKAVITFGKNIAIRYHILEQKQESTWTTSRYWFTSPVTFCYDLGKYAAVLNHNIVALWDEGDSSLANFQKVKLQEPIFDLCSKQDERTVVVVKNGRVAYLTDLSNEKKRGIKKPLLDPKEVLVTSKADEKNNQCFLITRSAGEKGNVKELSVVTVGIGNDDNETISRGKFGDGVNDILGYCICIGEAESFVVHFSSDGFIYSSRIITGTEKLETTKLSNVTNYISNTSEVTMCPLPDNSNIAIYGCGCEDGAAVLIYDMQYDLVASKQPLKLYNIPPFMERIGQSLFVPLSLHILVLNFRVNKSLLSSMVGKHQARLDEEVFEGRNPWKAKAWNADALHPDPFHADVGSKSEKKNKDGDIDALKAAFPKIWETIQQVKIFESEGQPEAVICNHVIPAALEKRNEEALDWILNTFLDIPEAHIVSMVVFSLQRVPLDSETQEPVERLNTLLLRKFDKHLLTQSLKHVAYDDIKRLLFYINSLMKNDWQLEFDFEDESPMKSWLKWCSALLDAHYTKFVLHNDTKLIDKLLDTVSECTSFMQSVSEMEPYLVMTYTKNSFEPTIDSSTQKWRKETVMFE